MWSLLQTTAAINRVLSSLGYDKHSQNPTRTIPYALRRGRPTAVNAGYLSSDLLVHESSFNRKRVSPRNVDGSYVSPIFESPPRSRHLHKSNMNPAALLPTLFAPYTKLSTNLCPLSQNLNPPLFCWGVAPSPSFPCSLLPLTFRHLSKTLIHHPLHSIPPTKQGRV